MHFRSKLWVCICVHVHVCVLTCMCTAQALGAMLLLLSFGEAELALESDWPWFWQEKFLNFLGCETSFRVQPEFIIMSGQLNVAGNTYMLPGWAVSSLQRHVLAVIFKLEGKETECRRRGKKHRKDWMLKEIPLKTRLHNTVCAKKH